MENISPRFATEQETERIITLLVKEVYNFEKESQVKHLLPEELGSDDYFIDNYKWFKESSRIILTEFNDYTHVTVISTIGLGDVTISEYHILDDGNTLCNLPALDRYVKKHGEEPSRNETEIYTHFN
jgi:hypothetical protein